MHDIVAILSLNIWMASGLFIKCLINRLFAFRKRVLASSWAIKCTTYVLRSLFHETFRVLEL